MTELYHVIIAPHGGSESLLLWDLSRTTLMQKFVKPYRKGKKISINGKIIDPNLLNGVRIIKTNVSREDAMERLMEKSIESTDKINADSKGGFFIAPLYSNDTDIEHVGIDVTTEFVTAAPGSARGIEYYFNHPWVLTVLGGVIATILAAVLLGGD